MVPLMLFPKPLILLALESFKKKEKSKSGLHEKLIAKPHGGGGHGGHGDEF